MTVATRPDHDVHTPATRTAPHRSLSWLRAHTNRRPLRADIEGMRALAVGLVVAYHAGIGGPSGGYIGVDLFFVISGFLITGLLLREHESTSAISIPSFYARRLRRIIPASALTLVATVVASGIILGPVRIGSIAKDALWSSAFLANFRFLSTGTNYLTATAPPSPLQHFWSLAVEEQFYIFWPAFLLLLLTLGKRFTARHSRRIAAAVTVALVAGSLFWCVKQTTANATAAYFSAWTRAWELGIGALIAMSAPLWNRLPRVIAFVLGYAGLGAVILAAVSFDTGTRFPGAAALLPVCGGAALIAAGTARRQLPLAAGRLIGVRPLVFIGGLSYTIYLWHWPILIIAEQRWPAIDTQTRALLVVATVALSFLTYSLVEHPIRFSPNLVGSPRRAIAMGLAMVLAAAAVSNAFVVMDRGRVASARAITALQEAGARTAYIDSATVMAAVAAAPQITKVTAELRPPLVAAEDDGGAQCYASEAVGPGKMCYLGDRKSTKIVVLYGDSHAGMWSYPLDLIAQRAHLQLIMLTYRGCPNPDLHMWSYQTQAPDTGCDEWHRSATAKINQLNAGLVVLTSSAYAPLTVDKTPITGADWQRGLSATISSLARPGRTFRIIGDIPYLNKVATDCLSVNENRIQACSTPTARAQRSVYRNAEMSVARKFGIHYIDPTPWICSAVCTPIVANFLVYKDDYHLTRLYASYLAGSLAQAMELNR
jgi:peptidoglycan/LPS O-acetylase OafA/YrhL